MKKSRYTESQIFQILKESEAGVPVPELCRKHGMSSASFYKWRTKYGGMDVSSMKRLKELEEENARLKWLDEHLFESIEHAQQTATEWLWRYNHERPHMALGGITPNQMLANAA